MISWTDSSAYAYYKQPTSNAGCKSHVKKTLTVYRICSINSLTSFGLILTSHIVNRPVLSARQACSVVHTQESPHPTSQFWSISAATQKAYVGIDSESLR